MADSSPIHPEVRSQFAQEIEAVGFVPQDRSGDCWVGDLDCEWIDPATGVHQIATHKLEISIGDSFPYKKPEVKPLDDLPGGIRHRAPISRGGALCLYSERQNGWLPSDMGSNLILRIREWFEHYHRDDWGVKDQLLDLHLYYPSANKRSLAMYGEDWSPPAGASGRFTVFEGSHVLVASNPSLGSTNPLQNAPQQLTLPLGIATKTSRVGLWFRLEREPSPAETLEGVLADIDRKVGKDKGFAQSQFLALVGVKLRKEFRTTVALGYPVSGVEQWLFLDVILPFGKTRANQWHRKLEEIKVRAYESAPSSREALSRRSAHTIAPLKAKVVAVFGLGALGSSIALLLAKAGVPKLIGVDGDRLRPGNCIRHEVGIGYSGWKKGIAMAAEVFQHAPYCEFNARAEVWYRQELKALIESADLIVDATANEAFSLLLNEKCVESRKPLVNVVTRHRASVGTIRIVVPKKTACCVCYLGIEEEDGYPLVPQGEEGEFIEAGCGDPTVESSALDLSLVSVHAARVAVDILSGRDLPGSECFIVNSPLAALPPLNSVGVHWVSRLPVLGCDICGVS